MSAGGGRGSGSSSPLREALEGVAGRNGIWLRGVAAGIALLAAALVALSLWFLLLAAVAVALGVLLDVAERRWLQREAARQQVAAVAAEVRTARAEAAAAQQSFESAEAGLRTYTLLVDTFDRIIRAIAVMALLSPAKRRAQFERLAKASIDAVLLVHKKTVGLRVALYVVEPDGQAMKVFDWGSQGYRREPKPFIRGTDRGDRAFQTLAKGEVLFVENIRDAPEIWGGSGSGYETFITCPIVVGRIQCGLLTVDAPATDDLTEDDKNGLRMVAAVISQVFALRGE